jgi:hypothetical protein
MNKLLTLANRELSVARQGSIELEVRLGKIAIPSYGASLNILRAITPVRATEKTISILARDDAAKKPLVIRKDHPAGTVTTMHKVELARYNGIDSAQQCEFKVALARETRVGDAQAPAPTDKVRLRIRDSRLEKIGAHTWSLDVTLICESTLEKMRANKCIKTDFFDTPEHKGAAHYEVEVELFERGAADITSDDISHVVARACAIAYPRGVDIGIAKSPRDLLIRYVARLISRGRGSTLKSILNSAVSLTLAVYSRDVFPMEGYFATDKADGVRGLALIDADGSVAIVTDSQMYGKCDAEKIRDIYDGEVIARESPQFYAFDCLMADGAVITNAPFESRLSAIVARDGIIVKEFQRIEVANIRVVVESIYNRANRPYAIDGLIFTQSGADYFATKNYKWKPVEANTIDFLCLRCPERLYGNRPYVLPKEAISLEASAKGRSDFRIYLLFCTCREQQRAEYCISQLPYQSEIIAPEMRNEITHFACRYEPHAYILIVRLSDLEALGGDIHGRVVEMRWRARESMDRAPANEPWRNWDLLRVRADRTVGNNISVATDVFANYVNPFPLEALWKPASGYFATETDETFVASNKYRRFILTTIIYNNLQDAKDARVLDLGGGLAQDFARYMVAGASLVVNFDMDAMAITESVMRVEKQTHGAQHSRAATWLTNLGARLRARKDCRAPSYIGRVIDVTALNLETFRATLTSIGLSAGIFSAVVSSFAFHYFCGSREMVERVFSFMDLALDATGIIIITTMNGERVFDLLQRNGGVWRGYEPSDATNGAATAAKYEIRAQWNTQDTIAREFGQMVRVSVPFASNMYEEPLCNFTAIRKIAAAAGFQAVTMIDYGNDALFALLQRADAELARKLSALDREYTSLFSTIIFKRGTRQKK